MANPLFHFPCQYPITDAFHCGFVVADFHCLEGAAELVHKIGVETAHTEGEFHSYRPHSGQLCDVGHVVEAEVEKIGAEGETVRVYDVSGRCLHVQPRAVGVLRFRMPTAGVYLVQVGGSPAQRIVLAVRE